MILLPRWLLHQLCEVFRASVWALSGEENAPPVVFETGDEGLTISSQWGGLAVTYTQFTTGEEQVVALPARALWTADGWEDAPILLDPVSPRESLVFQGTGDRTRFSFPTPDIDSLPDVPEEPSLRNALQPFHVRALHEAMLTAADGLVWQNQVELRGYGAVAATGGQAVLTQTGFDFPWAEDLCVRPTMCFGTAPLQNLWGTVGRTHRHVVFMLGPWTIALPIEKETRDSSAQARLPFPSAEPTRWYLSDANVAAMRAYLPTLPDADVKDAPVTLELGPVIHLTTSQSTTCSPGEARGQPVRITFDRRYLCRALELGFKEFLVDGANGVLRCVDQTRVFAWSRLKEAQSVAPAQPREKFPSKVVLGLHPRNGVVTVFVVRHSDDQHTQFFEHFLETHGRCAIRLQMESMDRLAPRFGTNVINLWGEYIAWADSCIQFDDASNAEAIDPFPRQAYRSHVCDAGLQRGNALPRQPMPPAAEQPLRRWRREEKERQRQERAETERLWATDIVFLGDGVSDCLSDRNSDVERLTAAGLPVLATPADVAQALEITIAQLRWLAFHAEVTTCVHYVSFTVPKKGGGERTLHAPLHRIGAAQRWILQNILAELPVEEACHGFCPGRGTASNAAVHAGRAVVVNMDLQSFFPSIGFRRVRSVFGRLGYSPAAATVLALLCTASPRREEGAGKQRRFVAVGPRALPQGACTSPALSNQVARRLDRRLAGLARTVGASYTRYADDLSFSGDEPLLERIGTLMRRVREVVRDEGFAVNEKKTRVQRRHVAQVVTGLVVNDRAGVVRKEVRRLRAILHRARTEGLEAQNRAGRPDFLAWLHGKIGYVSMARPEVGIRLQAELRTLLRKKEEGQACVHALEALEPAPP